MKVKLNDSLILKKVLDNFLILISIIGFFSIFFEEFFEKYMQIIIIILFVGLILNYVFLLICANNLKNINLKIGNSNLQIKEGNIFEEEGLKVINFNEYFDTLVDNKVIAEKSLNGHFINTYIKSKDDLDILDKKIEDELKEIETIEKRRSGKKKKYKLGEIIEYKNFLLTSLTKFDENNRANLNLKEYLEFLMNFWTNLDIIYSNRKVAITLFGSSSLTRFTDAYDINDEELLKIIIWTFKISKIKFKYPNKISIIISKDIANKINLYKIKEMNKYGI